ncbi:glycosyltransferase [Eudoraea adriatica]|uniref:glycosyltransferase n=1 Tax=Eudoraea adriatica TaxID=446681 RepID=UPI00035D41C6|nr:glycosyltransferase [Eudoraea adriatica]
MKTKKKILWVHNFSNEVGAGGVWMYNQYEYLKDEVDLYYLDNMRNPLRFVQHMFRLQKLAKSYDLVHAQYGSANGFLTSLMNCKRILSLKGSDWYVSPSSSIWHRIRVMLGGILTKFSLRRFHHIIVMSDAMKLEVLKKFPEAKIATIVDPIDFDRFRPLEKSEENEVKKVLFASVNLNNPIKRFPLAKKSFDFLHQKMPNTELITMSNIPHEEVNTFMNNVDVLILTSVYEGWPNVVKEMLACNKPFVSTKVSDLEGVAAKTNSCFTCNDTPEDLGQGLYRALNAEPEELRHLVKHFSMADSLNTIRAIYAKYL